MKTLIIKSRFAGERNARLGVAERLGFNYREIAAEQIHNETLFSKDQELLILGGSGDFEESGVALYPIEYNKLHFYVFLCSILPEPLPETLSRFDLVATPEPITLGDVPMFQTTGVAHRCTHPSIKKAAKEYGAVFLTAKRPLIAVLLGGKTLHTNGFSKGYLKNLASMVSEIAAENNASVIVANSPRTPEMARTIFQEHCAEQLFSFFDWREISRDLYEALLGTADAILATGDSLSMCCEAAVSETPLFTVFDTTTTEAPHRQILALLVTGGFIHRLHEPSDFDLKRTTKALDTIRPLAEYIQARLAERRDMYL